MLKIYTHLMTQERAVVITSDEYAPNPPSTRFSVLLHLKPQSESKAKVKFDRQIITTAISRTATIIYTGDHKLAARAKRNAIDVVMTWDLPLPPLVHRLR